MTLKQWLTLFAVCSAAGSAWAVFEDKSDHGANVNVKERAESQSQRAEVALRQEEARQEAARQRAEKIRNLPPDQVQAWIEGTLSEEALTRLSVATPLGDTTVEPVAIPRSRIIRLGVASVLVACLACALWLRRRQDQTSALASKKRV